MPSPPPFSGALRKLVLAIDVGTTFSGIAYAILDPGEVPKIQCVTRFPGQENGDFKIPSVLWYTRDGNVRAAGAEAASTAMRLIEEDEDIVFVEWFKLHLRPAATRKCDGLKHSDLPALPAGKSVIDIFADFLSYLYKCARKYITDTHPNGESLWASFENRIDIVLSHPNGWEGAQQADMRKAAVLGGLVPDNESGHSRVSFVTEGEASLNYCINSGLASTFIRNGANVMIVDAGGGTVDISSYTFTNAAPISVEETAPSDCLLQGSTRVNARAHEFLKAKLRNSKYGNEEDLRTMLEQFEKSAKPTFKDATDRSFMRFGSTRDKDLDYGIRGGQIAMEGKDMARFFEPSITAIVEAVKKQRKAATREISHAFLVGGFAASPWLFEQLKVKLKALRLDLARPDNHTNKAVAEGALSYYLQSFVSARVMRFTRAHVLTRPSGTLSVPNAFSIILGKGAKVSEMDEAEQPFDIESVMDEGLNSIVADVTCYRGSRARPQWTDTEPEYFATLCTIVADTSRVRRYRHMGSNGPFYRQEFKVVLSCGLTEMKAQISWMENGVEKRGPAKIVYDNEASAS